jgi:hypothetical protein
MKKIMLGFALAMGIITFEAFKLGSYEAKKNTAEVEQYQGVFVFTDSKPVSEYDFLGSVKGGISLSGQYSSVRDNLIKRAKKEYPNADALIMHFSTGGTDRCDAIKYK